MEVAQTAEDARDVSRSKPVLGLIHRFLLERQYSEFANRVRRKFYVKYPSLGGYVIYVLPNRTVAVFLSATDHFTTLRLICSGYLHNM